MGNKTHEISVKDLFVGNRERLSAKLKESVDTAESLVYLQGGPSETRFDTDHEPIFRQVRMNTYLCCVKDVIIVLRHLNTYCFYCRNLISSTSVGSRNRTVPYSSMWLPIRQFYSFLASLKITQQLWGRYELSKNGKICISWTKLDSRMKRTTF